MAGFESHWNGIDLVCEYPGKNRTTAVMHAYILLSQLILARDHSYLNDIFNAAIRNAKIELLTTIAGEWDDLGEALGLPHHLIQVIKADHPHDVRLCIKKVVNAWFENKWGHPPSWKGLCEALRDPLVERGDVALNIEKKYYDDESDFLRPPPPKG